MCFTLETYPSGDDMDRHLDKALSYFGLGDIDFRRAAVTQAQIEEFQLPHTPTDKQTLKKADHDTRKNGFVRKYGKLYLVELDALLAIVPKRFQIIVQDSVDQFFDYDIYTEQIMQHSESMIDIMVRQKVKFLDENQ
jgi:hypothetical protein